MLREHRSAVAAPVKVTEPEVYTSVVVLVVCTNLQKQQQVSEVRRGNKVLLDLIHNKNVTVILNGRRWQNDTIYNKVLD